MATLSARSGPFEDDSVAGASGVERGDGDLDLRIARVPGAEQLSPEHRRERNPADERGADPDEPTEDLVRHRPDNGNEHDLTDEPYSRRQQTEGCEATVAPQRHLHEKPGATAGMEAA